MKNHQEQIDNLEAIKNLMERSSRFLSLSGLSGISAGLIALCGAAIAFFLLGYNIRYSDWGEYQRLCFHNNYARIVLLLFIDGLATLLLALTLGLFFTVRRARRKGHTVWDASSKRLLFNLFVPLSAGGLLCIILAFKGLFILVAPLTLLFYGLALFSASRYTFDEIKYLGFLTILLGLFGVCFPGYGLVLWAIGFGLLHILYGCIMYFKYER
jgi:hypothetical protein